MNHIRDDSRGFTLLELMAVVTMIGILAAVAAPAFLKYLAHARQSEAQSMIPMIAAYEMAYKLRHGHFIPCASNPAKPGGKWDPSAAGWSKLGFAPAGVSNYSYQVILKDKTFVVRAVANLDDDPTLDEWEAMGADGARLKVDDSVQ